MIVMKKTLIILTIATIPFAATAQEKFQEHNSNLNMDVFNISATIFVVALVLAFVLSMLKRFLDFRIKSKIVEKGIQETLALSILKSSTKEDGTINFKWFSILAGIGAGLTIVNYTLPLGIHSLAIMSFSMALSFLGYYYFLKQSGK